MFERECTVYAYLLDYGRRLVADIADDDMAEQPTPNVNHPAWLLGHLTISTDYVLHLLGQPRRCPAEWHERFGPGTEPNVDRSLYPSKAELLDAWAEAHARAASAAAGASEEA